MKWFICAAISVILAVCSVNAEQNKEFRERAEIYSRLVDCDYYKATENNYTHFVDISSFKDPQPAGYLLRVPVYVLGPRDAFFILSTTNTPNRTTDYVYEIILGGWGNTRAVVRKRIENYALKDLTLSSVISAVRPLKVIIEMSQDGHINVFTDDNPEPLIRAYDPLPLPIKYVSFASHHSASVEFLYNCVSDKTGVLSPNAIQKEPWHGQANSLSEVPVEELVENCKFEEQWENKYTKFHEVSEIATQDENYHFNLEFYAYGGRDVHVLLSTIPKPDDGNGTAYEIIIGGWGNTVQLIRKSNDDEVFEKIQLSELLADERQTKILIKFSKLGELEVYVGELQYKPIVWVLDKKPLDVKYISFASNDGSRLLFFYNCKDNYAKPNTNRSPHPLLEGRVSDEEVLAKKCKHTHAWEETYDVGIKLAAIKNSQPEGYIVQLPVYVKGSRDVNILLTPNGSLDPKDGYEIVLGGWGNTRNLVRKNTVELANVEQFNLISEVNPVLVVVEVTSDGNIRVYTHFKNDRPLIEVKDPNPIADINTVSFSAYYRDVDFYYGCSADK